MSQKSTYGYEKARPPSRKSSLPPSVATCAITGQQDRWACSGNQSETSLKTIDKLLECCAHSMGTYSMRKLVLLYTISREIGKF